MKQLNTPFGTMYIDSWNPTERDEVDRIKIYDSRKDYLDYFCLDYFYDGIDEDSYAEKEYDKLCKMLELGAEEKDVEAFLEWLGVNFFHATTDKEKALLWLGCGYLGDLDYEDLEDNEYVNHLGDYYIIMNEA